MGNRILKNGICQNERIEALSLFAETLFYRLIVNCDDFGRFYADARIIKGGLFPLRVTLDTQTVEEGLAELEGVGLITLYEVKGKRYLYLRGWEEHQRLRYRKALFPMPTEDSSCEDSPSSHAYIYNNNSNSKEEEKKSEEEAEEKAEEKRREAKEEEKEEKENLKSEPPYIPPRGEEEPIREAFERFWAAYPRKEARVRAWRAFARLAPKRSLLERILAAIPHFMRTEQWRRDGGRYIPYPSKWLLEERWEECAAPQKTRVGSFDTDDFFAAAVGAQRLRFA